MVFRPHESEVNDLNNACENREKKPSIPLSVYANKLEEKVKKRYVEKISAIGIDPVLIEGKNFEPDCLPPVESTLFWRRVIIRNSNLKHFETYKRTIRWYPDLFQVYKATS